jgi:hypothetical protein
MAKEMSYLISKTDPVATALGTDLLTIVAISHGTDPVATALDGLKIYAAMRSVPRAVATRLQVTFKFQAPRHLARN